ncbi:hypothetical protein RRG08_004753 [Elysia crispata]|uniref:Uncharacterized protein n=1 Tax=Elysia crispata TaxID=231223 RepID=A0AAE1E0K9_9GAST|nr:hypothetical protein RRG08_004753 [Elysia crispata]
MEIICTEQPRIIAAYDGVIGLEKENVAGHSENIPIACKLLAGQVNRLGNRVWTEGYNQREGSGGRNPQLQCIYLKTLAAVASGCR